jgi:hypothetical protein
MISIETLFNKSDYNLTEDQQSFIKNNYTKYSLTDLARLVHENNSLNERSPETKTIKNFLIKLNRKNLPIELDETQRSEIESLSGSLGPVELARKIFKDPSLAPLSKEVKTVDKYIKVMGLTQYKTMDFEEQDDIYRPPKALSKLILKVNSAKHDANLSEESLTNQQRKSLESLRGFLHNHRFLATINGIKSFSERNLFESEFINGVIDKPDLNSEELNMYVSLCSDYVLLKQIKEQLDILNDELKSSIEDVDKGIKMALTEAYGKKAKEYDDCAKRMKGLQESLAGNRYKRMEGTVKLNSSLSVFVEQWKDETERKKMLLIAKAKEFAIKKEGEKLESEPEYIARIMGISMGEILNG